MKHQPYHEAQKKLSFMNDPVYGSLWTEPSIHATGDDSATRRQRDIALAQRSRMSPLTKVAVLPGSRARLEFQGFT
jgi:hypothetical protein